MGIDYYNCECGEIYPSDAEGGRCEGCGTAWCSGCSDVNQRFFYGGKPYCTNCFETDPVGFSDRDMLELAIEKLGTTWEALKEELLAKHPEFKESKHSYMCYDSSEHICASKCTTLEEDWEDDENYFDFPIRGRCCNSKKLPERCPECESAGSALAGGESVTKKLKQ